MKKIPYHVLAVLLLPMLSGCGAPVGLAASEYGGMYLTKNSEPPPADTASQIAPHESWCYNNLGKEAECFAEPQDTPPARLINVDPANRYPLTTRLYAETLNQNKVAIAAKEAAAAKAEREKMDVVPAGSSLPVQPAEMTPIPPPAAAPPPLPVPKATAHKPAQHKHKKTKKAKKPAAAPPAAAPKSKIAL